jgi:hypothetical protein
MIAALRRHTAFICLLLLFLGSVGLQSRLLPAFEGLDEALHVNYAAFIHTEGHLPDRAALTTNSTRQASGQGPLVYALTALILHLDGTPPLDGVALLDRLRGPARNPWIVPITDTLNRRDNLNLYVHGRDEEALQMPEAVRALHRARLVTLALGGLAVLGAYLAALECFGRSAWALTATALFAFMPTMLFTSAYFNNDIGAIAFGAWATWLSLRVMRRGPRTTLLLALGACLGLAGLAKVNALLIAPAAWLAVAWVCWSGGPLIQRLRQLAWATIWLLLPLGLILGPWVIDGWARWGDPLGLNTHEHADPRYYYAEPPPLATVLGELPALYTSYWGMFSPRGGETGLYAVFTGLVLLALLGYAVNAPAFTRTWRPTEAASAAVLLLMAVGAAAGLIRWLLRQSDVAARLMYPAHAAVILLLVLGWALLARRWLGFDHLVRGAAVGLVMLTGLALQPLNQALVYGLPAFRSDDELPRLGGPPVEFERTVRFLGYTTPTDILTGNTHPITLCWEVIQPTERPAAFSLKLVRDGAILADRTSLFGLGKFPSSSWRLGDRWCDSFDLYLNDPDIPDDQEPQPRPATTYDLLLIVLDSQTGAVDWQAAAPDGTPIHYPFIGQLRTP